MSESAFSEKHPPERFLYTGLSLMLLILALAGFVPLAVRQYLTMSIPADLVIHIHAVIYGAWLLLFVLQTVLAATDRIEQHKRMGKALACYAIAMYIVGLAVTYNRFVNNIRAGDLDIAQTINFAPFVDMLVFPIVFGLALYFIPKPEIHKRLMILACTVILYPAMVRIEFGPIANHFSIFLLTWMSPILIGMASDFRNRRQAHPVYLLGLALLLVLALRPHYAHCSPWIKFTRWLISVST